MAAKIEELAAQWTKDVVAPNESKARAGLLASLTEPVARIGHPGGNNPPPGGGVGGHNPAAGVGGNNAGPGA